MCKSIVVPAYEERTLEESIILVNADSKEQAEQLAREYFISSEDMYVNALGGTTSWKFVAILNTFELIDDLPTVPNFTEVYSRFLIVDNKLTDEKVVDIYFKGIR